MAPRNIAFFAFLLTELASIVATFAWLEFCYWSLVWTCVDTSAGCSFEAFRQALFGEDWPLFGLLLLSIAFLASATGMFLRRKWARQLGVIAWLASALSVVYLVYFGWDSSEPHDFADRLYQAAPMLPSVLAIAFLLSPAGRRQFLDTGRQAGPKGEGATPHS